MAVYAAPSSAPVSITVSNLTSRSFSTQWQPPVPSDRNGIVRAYEITLTNGIDGGTESHTVSGNITSLEFHDLHPAYTYVLRVAAVTISQGPFSVPVRVTMAEDGKQRCIPRLVHALL